jgi:3-(3-hydroxy-phenyl)propionate hydroxylase
MPKTYENPVYPYRRSSDQDADQPVRHPVIVVGAGLVGLTAAVDLALRGRAVVVLDDDDTVSYGSRAICFSKRTLEICDRLGVAEALRAKGVTWNRGKVFFRDRKVYDFDLLPEDGHNWPAFVNLQQYYAEEWLVDRAVELGVEIRWRNKVIGVSQDAAGVALAVDTPEGPYRLACDYLLACDGARSFVRHDLGLAFQGQVFKDRFLICDVVMKAEFPTERWFWFDPPFHPKQSALLHKQADDVWRIDLQLGWEADPEEEKKPERVIPRLQAMLGEDAEFELEWISVYTFQCRRLERFRHGHVFFLGDAAHQVSPFGARGGNGGVQDADNLIWKLDLVLAGKAPPRLLDSYDEERLPAADENILHSTRSTDFITPKNAASQAFRDAALELSEHFAFARGLVNSGRLSLPCVLEGSPLNTPGGGDFDCAMVPGAPALDAPLVKQGAETWLLRELFPGFTLLVFAGHDDDLPLAELAALADDEVPIATRVIAPGEVASAGLSLLQDRDGFALARYDSRPETCYLLRPDQHVAARFRRIDLAAIRAARARALGRDA